jgi:hypothetical protein
MGPCPRKKLMKYVVAFKREARGQMKQGLTQLLATIPGADNIVGSDNDVRVQVDLTPEAIAKLQEVAPGQLYIEPLYAHKALSA